MPNYISCYSPSHLARGGKKEVQVDQGGETEIEMVLRHIRQGERHVARQHEIVASLPPDSALAKTARQLLAQFEYALESHHEHLARLMDQNPEAGL